jgi:branched-chain amino acid transport system substrate-binding protein
MRLFRSVLYGAAMLFAAMVSPSQAADPIRIGFSMSLTGGLAGGGKAALPAYERWRHELNAKPWLHGRQPDFAPN